MIYNLDPAFAPAKYVPEEYAVLQHSRWSQFVTGFRNRFKREPI